MKTNTESVAVIGAGVAGLTAAWLLQRKYRVTLFEKNDYAGGHTRTITVPDGPDAGTAVDTGFIVMNERNYPLFSRILDQLHIERGASDMSFSFSCNQTGLSYAGTNVRSLFPTSRTLFRREHWGMIGDILRFNKESQFALAEGRLEKQSLQEFVQSKSYGKAFVDHYLYPMGAAIWSSPLAEMAYFPAESFVHFFENHGLLSIKDRPQWQYVKGGSQQYVQAMRHSLQDAVRLCRPVQAVQRNMAGADVRLDDGDVLSFDHVVIATHADEALAMLDDPSRDERKLLGAWEYSRNEAVLHTDRSVMPASSRAWASWNVRRGKQYEESHPVSVTYHMNRLQRLQTEEDYFVSLNMESEVDETRVVDRTVFTHPTYTFNSLSSQRRLPLLNGLSHTYYCGSYFGYGFHEDAVRSAVSVAERMGVRL